MYLCGEYTCSFNEERKYPWMIGKEHSALFMLLEHRYYGMSQPFEDWSTENLKLLNTTQAIEDIAYFIDEMNLSL